MTALDLILHPFAQADLVAEAYQLSFDQLLQLIYQQGVMVNEKPAHLSLSVLAEPHREAVAWVRDSCAPYLVRRGSSTL